jgi:hypothetical protein
MIQAIGYMIGAYIFVRMIQIIIMTERKKATWLLRACAIFGLIVAIGGIAFLIYQDITGAIALKNLFQDHEYLIK